VLESKYHQLERVDFFPLFEAIVAFKSPKELDSVRSAVKCTELCFKEMIKDIEN